MEEQEKLDILVIDDSHYETTLTRKFARRTAFAKANPKHILAYIPGVIQELHVKPGQTVRRGDSLLVLEAMKMRNDVTAPHDGIVGTVHVQKNARVMKNQLLIEFE